MTDEIRDMLQKRVENNLKEIANLPPGVERESLVNETNDFLRQLKEAEQVRQEYLDKEERRNIEREKMEAALEQEKVKQKVTWQRALLEMGKVVVPAAMSIAAFFEGQKRLLNFEDHGHLTTQAAKELHLPKFMK